jgi:malonate transporter and related proteins
MWAVALAVMPIFLLLVLGNVLRRNGFPGGDFWDLADKLTYWVLFPSLLFQATSTAPLSNDVISSYAFSLWSAAGTCAVFALFILYMMKMHKPIATSVLQGAVRHNTFIAFAVCETLLGPEGVLLAAVATAVLVPPTNLFCVSMLVIAQGKSSQKSLFKRLVQEIIRNPLIVAIFLGGCLNLSGLGPIPIIDSLTVIMSKAALPFALLSVGAGLHIKAIRVAGAAVAISSISKLLIFPTILALTLTVSGLTGTPAIVIMVYGAVPTASSGYALAKLMGGDAQVMAGIITVQTLLSLATIPVIITIAMSMFG